MLIPKLLTFLLFVGSPTVVQGFQHLFQKRLRPAIVGQFLATKGPPRTASTKCDWIALSHSRVSCSQLRLSASYMDAPMADQSCDILILGSGPAARAVASLLSAANMDVLLCDKAVDRQWPPNYGAWADEWEAIVARFDALGVSLDTNRSNNRNSVDREWPVTDCYFGGSFGIPTSKRLRLDRPYVRIDRLSLRQALTINTPYRMLQANHISRAINVNVYSPPGSLVHDEEGTTIKLQMIDQSFLTVRSRLVIDCTGHETKLVLREPRDASSPPGFQMAYGVLVEVEESPSNDRSRVGPYDKDAMTLFDYRTDHFSGDDDNLKASRDPTFMYAMPLKDNEIFFEETSLVARPAISFRECKERCMQRLKHHDIRVKNILEEEFCYIPMGGALPMRDQRVVALGGAAAMVHPSTGYSLCRVMMGAADLAEALIRERDSPEWNLDRTAAAGYDALWSPGNIRQRNFAVYGGEFLMKQSVEGLRGFFDGFFRLPTKLWSGFLAGWPGLPNNEAHETWSKRLIFGITFVVKLPLPVALDMLSSIVSYTLSEGNSLLQSVTPFFGEPPSYQYKPNQDVIGDVAAKQEGRNMIQASRVMNELPVFLDETAGTVAIPDGDITTPSMSFETNGARYKQESNQGSGPRFDGPLYFTQTKE